MQTTQQYPALTESTFFIMISLTTPLHGYGIIKKTAELSNNRIQLAPGTLYGALNTLLQKNYIQLHNHAISSKKKEYSLTNEGFAVLENELKRLNELYLVGTNILGGTLHEANTQE